MPWGWFGNFIFAISARIFCENHLKTWVLNLFVYLFFSVQRYFRWCIFPWGERWSLHIDGSKTWRYVILERQDGEILDFSILLCLLFFDKEVKKAIWCLHNLKLMSECFGRTQTSLLHGPKPGNELPNLRAASTQMNHHFKFTTLKMNAAR